MRYDKSRAERGERERERERERVIERETLVLLVIRLLNLLPLLLIFILVNVRDFVCRLVSKENDVTKQIKRLFSENCIYINLLLSSSSLWADMSQIFKELDLGIKETDIGRENMSFMVYFWRKIVM